MHCDKNRTRLKPLAGILGKTDQIIRITIMGR